MIKIFLYEMPKNFQEAYNHPDKAQREKWCEAIWVEFRKMIKQGVWRLVNKQNKHKRVFKVKRDERIQARLVASSY